MKFLIGLLLSVFTYFVAVEYIEMSQKVVLENGAVLLPLSQADKVLYPLLFSLTVLLALCLIAVTSSRWKKNFSIIQVVVLAGLGLNLVELNWASSSSIHPQIINELAFSYKNLFMLPSLFAIPVFLIKLFNYINLEKRLEKLQLFNDGSIDIRTKRFCGNLIDITICLIINFILMQLGVFIEMLLPFVVTYFLYKFILEASVKSTVGKSFFRLSVVSLHDHEPSIYQILLRNFCRIIPFYAVPVLLNKTAMHDLLSDTRVGEKA